MNNCALCDAVKSWVMKPYKEDGTVFDWFLFLGLMAIFAWLWARIIKRIA